MPGGLPNNPHKSDNAVKFTVNIDQFPIPASHHRYVLWKYQSDLSNSLHFQNSLYSHLNRVHGVKKDMLSDIQLQMVPAAGNANNAPAAGSSSGGGGGGGSNPAASTAPAATAPPPNTSNDNSNQSSSGGGGNAAPGGGQQPQQQDAIMDLAHHSDSSN